MAKEYIDKEAFAAEKRKLYCEDCDRRKSMKDKSKFVYDIGDAPCRACDIDDMIDAVEDFPAADVVEVVRCRECKYGTPEKNAKGENMISCDNDDCPCGYHAFLMPPDWYCADGERRDNDA